MKGKFTGVGVGPGDPELLTLKALHAIQKSDVIAIPVSDSTLEEPSEKADQKYAGQCTAFQIVKQVYPEIENKELIFLPMPMIKDRKKLMQIHDKDAEFTGEKLNQGKNVAFLTIGDPGIYSTCMYVHKRVKRMGYETELIPGIPSFCAAAARLDISLSENRDELHIIPASYGVEESIRLSGTKVFMKSGRKMAEVRRFLLENGLEAKMVENCGMDSEKLSLSTEEIPEQAGYYSLLIVKGKKEG
jgi:precorrin-2/cobalt-factor-2 C20-methyltransferase